ncbi:MAG: Bax inhibitor-1/YccA family protein [Micavibrio aeruginosavorus]|uniref:Bax inhibitor-1/YccA family protein n=1 Tax=Micavibrio aeruginosavorus TaxID=349221 RepID=A0A7T5R1E6_9BACT|nr:MAG: Bax inhibitor-1/YccA family protein [Micavibrio aeruginosavorus]
MAIHDISGSRYAPVYDEGLRAYMLKIYNYMAAALTLTGLAAWFSAHSPAILSSLYVVQGQTITGMSGLGWIVMLAPLGLVFYLSFGLRTMSLAVVQISYWIYAGLLGLSLSVVFLAYTDESIARVFFIAAGTFAGMSIIGYLTKKDLTGLGSFMMMGLTGLIIASLVNLFLKREDVQFALSAIGVVIFVGLTAFDTQKLKNLYAETADSEWTGKVAIMGALILYLDFINIFLSLLQLLGQRKNR